MKLLIKNQRVRVTEDVEQVLVYNTAYCVQELYKRVIRGREGGFGATHEILYCYVTA